MAKQKLNEFVESACSPYCESLTDDEFRWLVEGVTDKLRAYLIDYMEKL